MIFLRKGRDSYWHNMDNVMLLSKLEAAFKRGAGTWYSPQYKVRNVNYFLLVEHGI